MSEETLILPSILQYEELMTEEGITKKQLPKNIIHKTTVLSMTIGRFIKNPNKTNKDKVIALDIEIADAIQDWIEESNVTASAEEQKKAQLESEEKDKAALKLIEEEKVKKEKEQKEEKLDPKGVKIDLEFDELIKANKTDLTIEQLKQFAPTAYEVVFDAYEEGGENGVRTSKYLLKEVEKEKFKLSINN